MYCCEAASHENWCFTLQKSVNEATAVSGVSDLARADWCRRKMISVFPIYAPTKVRAGDWSAFERKDFAKASVERTICVATRRESHICWSSKVMIASSQAPQTLKVCGACEDDIMNVDAQKR